MVLAVAVTFAEVFARPYILVEYFKTFYHTVSFEIYIRYRLTLVADIGLVIALQRVVAHDILSKIGALGIGINAAAFGFTGFLFFSSDIYLLHRKILLHEE